MLSGILNLKIEQNRTGSVAFKNAAKSITLIEKDAFLAK
jgi:hypothetical protein